MTQLNTVQQTSRRAPAVPGASLNANGKVIVALRQTDGLTQEELAKACGCDRKTIIRMEQDQAVKQAYLEAVALHFKVPIDYLIETGDSDPLTLPRAREWDLRNAIHFDKVRELPHRLLVRTCKLRSQTFSDRWGRAKVYDLGNLARERRELTREVLRRHTEACAKVRSPHVVIPYICEPNTTERYCLSVDEWIDGQWLSTVSQNNPLSVELAHLAYELLLALKALHSQSIVCRGLTPNSVVIRTDHTVMIADLELAKLLTGCRTIRPPSGIARNEFIAPEVHEQGSEIKWAADIFSWAMIVTHFGTKEANGNSRATRPNPKMDSVPDEVCAIVQEAISQRWTKRPQTIDAILKVVAAWARSTGYRRHD